MANLFELMNQGALGSTCAGGNGKEASSIPILKLIGISDAKVGTLGALSTNGLATKEVDGFGVFKKTKLEEILKGGGPSGGGGDTGEVTAPSFQSMVSASRGSRSDYEVSR
jgi:hypothetical protein